MIENMDFIIDFILNIDQYMVEIVHKYHLWTYAILFLVIFCETGLVFTPFLPGDSLLLSPEPLLPSQEIPLIYICLCL